MILETSELVFGVHREMLEAKQTGKTAPESFTINFDFRNMS